MHVMEQTLTESQCGQTGSPCEPVLSRDTLSSNTAVNFVNGMLPPHWERLSEYLNSLGNQELARRWKKARQIIHEHGAAFNILTQKEETERPWELDPVPLPISKGTWQTLENGIRQRARLLSLIYRDIYGNQSLIHNRQLPAELIFANPGFIRQCCGIAKDMSSELHLFSSDLIRPANGEWQVVSHGTQTPAGIGYALENRIVLSRILPRMFHSDKVQRLAPFFKHLTNSLMEISVQKQVEPTIVMLSEGPSSPFYFEHVFLARYLGYTLVESSDLTVRNNTVFLKTLGGLHSVDVILRQVKDNGCDPLIMCSPDLTGVPGLMQAIHSGKVAVCNPIGTGVLESPGLTPFLPGLCNAILGEDLILKNTDVLWCGNPDSLNQVIDALETRSRSLTIVSAFGSDHARAVDTAALDRDQSQTWIKTIKSAPYAWSARLPVTPFTLPAWSECGVLNRYASIRMFATAKREPETLLPGDQEKSATEIETAVMAGALTRVSDNPVAFLFPGRQKQGSKDTWCLSDKAAGFKSMLHKFSTPYEIHRGSDLPSRVADNMLWLGRYMERTEGALRLLRSLLSRINSDIRLTEIQELPFLMCTMARMKIMSQALCKPGAKFTMKVVEQEMHQSVFNADLPGSVLNCLNKIKQVASRVRDRLSNDSWLILGRIEKEMSQLRPGDKLSEIHGTINEIILSISAFAGLAFESMTRGMGWRFMDMGRRMERAAQMTIMLKSLVREPKIPAGHDLKALLEIADSTITYHTRYRTTLHLEPVVDLLLIDELNPKAVGFQMASILAHVEALPRKEPRPVWSLEEKIALKLTTQLRLADTQALMEKGPDGGLPNLVHILEQIHSGIEQLADTITQHYLSRIETEKQLKLELSRTPGSGLMGRETHPSEV